MGAVPCKSTLVGSTSTPIEHSRVRNAHNNIECYAVIPLRLKGNDLSSLVGSKIQSYVYCHWGNKSIGIVHGHVSLFDEDLTAASTRTNREEERKSRAMFRLPGTSTTGGSNWKRRRPFREPRPLWQGLDSLFARGWKTEPSGPRMLKGFQGTVQPVRGGHGDRRSNTLAPPRTRLLLVVGAQTLTLDVAYRVRPWAVDEYSTTDQRPFRRILTKVQPLAATRRRSRGLLFHGGLSVAGP